MKKIVPLITLLLLLSGCAGAAPAPAPPSSTELQASSAGAPISNAEPLWQYGITEGWLCRTDRSGNTVRICPETYASDVIFTEDWLYFGDEKTLYRMDNAGRRELLLNEECWSLSLNSGWLYYITDSGIMRMKPDGSQKEQVILCECYGMALSENTIFYADYYPTDPEPGQDDGPQPPLGVLHRADLSGENDMNLGVSVNYLGIYGDTVYYSDTEDYDLYSMNPETGEKTAVYTGYFINGLCFGGGYAFFESDHKLLRLSLADGTSTVVKEDFGFWLIGVFDDYLYFYEFGNEYVLYRLNLNAAKPEKVADTITVTPESAADTNVPSYVGGTDVTSNTEIQILQDTVLVNELDSNAHGLFYLGMTEDELLSILRDNEIYFYNMENDPGEGDTASYDNSCLYYFSLFEDTVSVYVGQDAVDSIEMRGQTPLKATSTKAGFNLGDSASKMIALYGEDYTVDISQIPGEELYKVYTYKLRNHCFYVYFLNGIAERWGISTNS